MARVAAIVSGKGGVGKSTLTAGIGAALARRGRRVLLVDGDAGLRSLDYLLGVTEELVFDSADIVSGYCEPLKAVYPCAQCAGLFVLPAPQDHERVIPPALMCRLVRLLEQYFDWVLIDGPAGIGRGFYSAVAPASMVLVVATPDPVCIRGSGNVRALLQRRSRNIQCRLLLNRFSAFSFRRADSFEDLDQVIDTAGIQLLGIVPEDAPVALWAARGMLPPLEAEASLAFQRIAARMEGEAIPLASFEK